MYYMKFELEGVLVMAFGFKIKKVKLQNNYTLEELFEKIKDTDFAPGKPEYVKHGFAYVIAFPALDSHNQVQILPASMKKQSNSFQVMKAEAAGVSNMVGNIVKDELTDGLLSIRGVFGKNAKQIETLVEETAKQLENMGL